MKDREISYLYNKIDPEFVRRVHDLAVYRTHLIGTSGMQLRLDFISIGVICKYLIHVEGFHLDFIQLKVRGSGAECK